MKENTPNPPISFWMVISVLASFAAFYLSTFSPFVLILPVLFIGSLLLPYRFEQDSSGIWGLRLLVYVLFAVLGRAPTGMPSYFVDAMSFTTAGLMAGGELVLQAFRRPPEGARYDPWIVSLSGVIFLIACNSLGPHITYLAPIYMTSLLFSLGDLRPSTGSARSFSSFRRVFSILAAVALGMVFHQNLQSQRERLMSLSSRLLTESSATTQSPGIAENPQLGNGVDTGNSTARLLRITGSLKDQHLRAAAFDLYVNGTWGPAISQRGSSQGTMDSALPKQTRETDPNGVDFRRAKADAKITLLRDDGGVLFAPLNSWGIIPDNGQSFNWDRFQGPFMTEEPAPVSYYIVDSKTEKYDFQVEQGPLCVKPDEEQRQRLLDIPPEIDDRVLSLARKVAQGGKTQAEKAAKIVDYLFKTNKYSLKFVRGPQDPVSDFVLNKKSAHCQYFASAAVMMMRAAGIPARYVTGFYANERAEDGSTIVRARDAHAWTEAYLDNIGWVEWDATPPSGRADPAVHPDPWYQHTLEKVQDNFARLRAWFSNLTQLQILEIMATFLAVWGLERWRQARKKARKRTASITVPPEFAPLARRFERLLSKRGVNTSEGRPWSESVPAELQQEREWVEDYNRARFDELDLEEIIKLEKELHKLEK
jgi:transglutaminase-like putative cysteine protease